MAAFSDCLEVIKSRRNLTAAHIAGICEMDRTVIFRWCNGSALPESWEQVVPLIKKLRLTGEEKRQLRVAFEKERIGLKQSSCFAEMKSIFYLLKQEAGQTRSGNQELYQNAHPDSPMPEFLLLYNQMDLLRCVQKALSELVKKRNMVLYLNVKALPENLLILLEQFGRAVHQSGTEIIIGIAEYSYRSEIEKLRLLHTLLELQGINKKITWRCLKDIDMQDGQSWILADNYYIQFPEDMKSGIMTRNREWLRFFAGMGKRLYQLGAPLMQSCRAAEANRSGTALPVYIMGNPFKEDDVAENTVVFFTESGLADCSREKLREILHSLKQKKRRRIMLKDKHISLEQICVKLFDGQEGSLEISFYPDTKEEQQIIVTDRALVNQFQSFLEYIAGTDWAYTAEEAVGLVRRMMR